MNRKQPEEIDAGTGDRECSRLSATHSFNAKFISQEKQAIGSADALRQTLLSASEEFVCNLELVGACLLRNA